MKIVVAVLLFLISISNTINAQSSTEDSGTKIRLPVLKNVAKGSVSVPDGGLLVKGRNRAKPIQESPSIKSLVEATRHAGRSRDTWVKPGSRSATGNLALARNSKFSLTEELELTDKQKELFANKAQQILKSYEKMLQESVQELLDSLTPKQIEKLKSNLGSDFENKLFPTSASLLRELQKLNAFKK